MNWKEVNDYVEIAVLIPAIIGGLWQAYELASISTSFIRFFSVSQVVPDGLLILFSGICVFISYKISLVLIKFLPFYNNRADKWWVSTIAIIAYMFIGTVILYYYYVDFIKQDYFQLSDLTFSIIFVVIFSNIIFYLLPYSFRIKLKSAFSNKTENKKDSSDDLFSKFKGVVIVIIGAIILVITSLLVQNFRQNYVDISELQNLKCLNNILSEKSDIDNSTIIYFNDKYIFTKSSDSNDNTDIKIFKIDILFDECGIPAGKNGYHK